MQPLQETHGRQLKLINFILFIYMATSTALGYNSIFNIETAFNGSVSEVKSDSNGKILIGGAFTTFTGSTQNRLIRLNSDGSKDTTFDIGTGFNNDVNSIEIDSNGKILVGGSFTTFTGSTQNRLIRLNSDGSKDTTFDIGVGFTSVNSNIRSIVVDSDGKILVGGVFTLYSGSSQNYLIRLNSDGSKDTTFDIGTGFNGLIYSIAIQSDGKILAGGNFIQFTGATTGFALIRLNSNGSKDTTLDIGTGFGSAVRSVVIQSDGKILVGGQFTTFTGSTQNRLIRLNSNGSKDTTLNIGTGFNGDVYSIEVQSDGKILIGGAFTTFTGSTQNRLIRLNSDGSKDTTFDIETGFDNSIFTTLIQSNEKILTGGLFTTYKDLSQNRLTRLNYIGNIFTGETITGTQQIGDLSVVTASTISDSSTKFWMGPDEQLGYIVGLPEPLGNITTPTGQNAFLSFIRSNSLTEPSFLSMVNLTFNQSFTTGTEAKTWLNSNGYWTSWGSATPSSVLIGYYSSTSVFINDCTDTFTATTANSPLYMAYSYSGFTYSLGQLPNNGYTTGVPFYTDANLTTPLPSLFGPVYAFSPTQGGRPYRKIRIGNTSYDGWSTCGPLIPNGYMVESATKVNVGNSQRDYMSTDDTSSPYPGKTIYQNSSGTFFSNGTTWAWAAQPNVTATHLFVFGNSSFILTLS